jgi:hypothetical protein
MNKTMIIGLGIILLLAMTVSAGWTTYDDFSTFDTDKWESHMGTSPLTIESGALVINYTSDDTDWPGVYGGIISKEGFDFSTISAIRILEKAINQGAPSEPVYTQTNIIKGAPDCGNARGYPQQGMDLTSDGSSRLFYSDSRTDAGCTELGTIGGSYTLDTYYWVVFRLTSSGAIRPAIYEDNAGSLGTLVWNDTESEYKGFANNTLNLTLSAYLQAAAHAVLIVDQIDTYTGTSGCVDDSDCGFCGYCMDQPGGAVCGYQTGSDNNADCPFCQYCDLAGTGVCEYQASDEDVKSECGFGTPIGLCGGPGYWTPASGCNTTWVADCRDEDQIIVAAGSCDGYGSCTENYPPIDNGTVCINGTSVPPSANMYCGIWRDCSSGQSSALEYYVGYQNSSGDPSPCSDNDWQVAGTTWVAPTGYGISITEHAFNCSVEVVPSQSLAPPPSQAGAIAAASVGAAGGRASSTQGLGAAQIIGLGIVAGIILYNAGLIGKGKIRGRRK